MGAKVTFDLLVSGRSSSSAETASVSSCESQSSHECKVCVTQSPAPPRQSVRGIGMGRSLVQCQSGWMVECLCGSWRVIGQRIRQSLSEPTADEPFRFLFGALGFESSSSDALLEALSSSLLVGGAAPFLERGDEAGALRRDFGGFA